MSALEMVDLEQGDPIQHHLSQTVIHRSHAAKTEPRRGAANIGDPTGKLLRQQGIGSGLMVDSHRRSGESSADRSSAPNDVATPIAVRSDH